ncbi:MAG: hypothetical protein FWF56_00515 [Firmicutes bacterium]|nr:hypothetical protein [Bacillota bacterium]MCL1953751.1 hypothetical protein [Bacillota bacterium]
MKNTDIIILNNIYKIAYSTNKLFLYLCNQCNDEEVSKILIEQARACDKIVGKCLDCLDKLHHLPTIWAKVDGAIVFVQTKIKLFVDNSKYKINQIVLKACFDNIVLLFKLTRKCDPFSIYIDNITACMEIFESTINMLRQ